MEWWHYEIATMTMDGIKGLEFDGSQRRLKTMNLLYVFMVACPLFIKSCDVMGAEGEAIQESTHVIEALAENMKIIEAELVLKDFQEGKTMTRVVVTLSEPVRFEQDRDFKDPAYRNELREAVRAVQEQVISRLDPSKVQITNRFVYIFGFSAEVTIDGLKELTEINEVLTISKDRVLKTHSSE